MKTLYSILVCLLVLILLPLPGQAAHPAAEGKWQAGNCSCSPNVSQPVFGYYELPDQPADEPEFINFSLLTRIEYFCKTLKPDGRLIDQSTFDTMQKNISLSRQFNTKIDLGIKLSEEFDQTFIPQKNHTQLAGQIIRRISAFNQKQKKQIKEKREALVKEFTTSHFQKTIDQLKEKVNQMDKSFVAQEDINKGFMAINKKLNASINLFLKYEKAAKLLRTEKEKTILKERIVKEMKGKDPSFIRKVFNYLNIFKSNKTQKQARQNLKTAEHIIQQREEIIQYLINNSLKQMEALENKTVQVSSKKETTNEETMKDNEPSGTDSIVLSNPDILMDAVVRLEADYRDCLTGDCSKDLKKLEKDIKTLLVKAEIPRDVADKIVEIVVGSPSAREKAKKESVKTIISEQIKNRKHEMETIRIDWEWKDTSGQGTGKLINDLSTFIRRTGFDGLALDISELSMTPGNKAFLTDFISKLHRQLPGSGAQPHISLIISQVHITPDLQTIEPYVDYIILKLPAPIPEDLNFINTLIGGYVKTIGATDKLLLYMKSSNLGLLESSGQKIVRTIKKDTQGLCLDRDVFVSSSIDDTASPVLLNYIIQPRDMFFARKLLYRFNQAYFDICTIICPYKNLSLSIVKVLVAAWFIIWLLASSHAVFDSFCTVNSFISRHFFLFWGAGAIIFTAAYTVILCDPFLKERRDDAVYILAGILMIKILFFLWKKAGTVNR